MRSYRAVAVPDSISTSVRRTLRSPGYGHPAHTEVAAGHGPCRQCLRNFAVGEERRILFTYDPFGEKASLPLPGPVFIHESECERYPEDGGFPPDLLKWPLTLNAYASGRRLVAQRYVSNGDAESEIERLLENEEVAYIHVRDTKAGCYDFRVERVNGERNGNASGAPDGGQSDE